MKVMVAWWACVTTMGTLMFSPVTKAGEFDVYPIRVIIFPASSTTSVTTFQARYQRRVDEGGCKLVITTATWRAFIVLRPQRQSVPQFVPQFVPRHRHWEGGIGPVEGRV